MTPDNNALRLSRTPEAASDDRLLTFIQVADEHRNYLTWVAARLTAGTEEAEDVVQQALLKAFVNLSRFRGDAKMRTWLYRIVLNTAREHLRNQRRRVPLKGTGGRDEEDENILLNLPHPGMSPEDHVERNELAAILHSEIEVLTPVCKRTLEMCVIRELSHQEVAKALNTSVATGKARVYRAKAMLQQAMDLRIHPCKGKSDRARHAADN